jgi:hypothetical protein
VICLLLPLLAAAGRALYLPRREIGQQLFCLLLLQLLFCHESTGRHFVFLVQQFTIPYFRCSPPSATIVVWLLLSYPAKAIIK